MKSHVWIGIVGTLGVGAAVAGAFALFGGNQEVAPTGTLSLTSVPVAEAWIDGKPSGTTPLSLAVRPGEHEVVLKQAGFTEERNVVQVRADAVARVEGSLIAKDANDPEALRLLAQAYDMNVERPVLADLHRGGNVSKTGVVLMFPRNDVRREGLGGYRIDTTAAYNGGGTLEFRRGKKALYSEAFDPNGFVVERSLPAEVAQDVIVGDRITWGIWFDDGRDPITAQFEVVSKPQVAKKLTDLETDKNLSRQPPVMRELMKAQTLLNYRLYSEALVKYLDIQRADSETTLPQGGMVACLRRMDLDETDLYRETARRVAGAGGRAGRGVETGVGSGPLPGRPALASRPPQSGNGGAPAPTGLRPGGSVAPGLRGNGTPGAPSATPTTPTEGVGSTPGVAVNPLADAIRRSDELRARSSEATRSSDLARRQADEAQARLTDAERHAGSSQETVNQAREAAAAARRRAEESGTADDRAASDRANEAFHAAEKEAEATRRAFEAARQAAEAANARAVEAARVAAQATAEADAAARAASGGAQTPVVPSAPVAPTVPQGPGPIAPEPAPVGPGPELPAPEEPAAPAGGN